MFVTVQGATERCNRSIRDKVSALLMLAPTLNWGFQVTAKLLMLHLPLARQP